MKYQVIVTPEAQAGIRESFAYIPERSPLNAARWLPALYGEKGKPAAWPGTGNDSSRQEA